MSPSKPNPERAEVAPDQLKLSSRQATRLASLAGGGITAKNIAGLSVAELSERFKWRIDPALLFFRKVCGRVVKRDPVTGVEYPVPFATVTVEDTDCTLLGYFPPHWPWGWFFPLRCRREVLATVQTDECGRFCVYIPRFDIDWILRWRHRRICFPWIFQRPWLKDLVDIPEVHPVGPIGPIGHGPGSGPGPVPFASLAALPPGTLEAIGGGGMTGFTSRLQRATLSRSFGGPADDESQPLEVRAFDRELPPPLPSAFQQVRARGTNVVAAKGADPDEAMRAAIATQAGVPVKELAALDLSRFIGPFRRCIDIVVPEWQLISDTPDITFRVQQDVDGDGDLETIYSEGYFDVRWNAGPIPDVTLVASDIARESRACNTPPVTCRDVPALLFAGMMPLTDASIFDSATGYTVRTNRPFPPGAPVPPPLPRPDVAESPFMGVLQLYGCVNVPKAAFYRVMKSLDGGPYSAVTGLQWNIYPLPSGAPHLVAPDANGWYPVLPNPTAFHPDNLVLEWPTAALGKYTLKIETGTAAKAHLGFSAEVAIQVDNTAPTVLFTRLAWKFDAEPDSAFDLPGRSLLGPCPTIRRGVAPQGIQVQFDVVASAHHLRDAGLATGGCGGGNFTLVSPPPATTAHWHRWTSDNGVALSARYALAGTTMEGSYSFSAHANSRAMNPAGSDMGDLLFWNYDPVFIHTPRRVDVAVVNA